MSKTAAPVSNSDTAPTSQAAPIVPGAAPKRAPNFDAETDLVSAILQGKKPTNQEHEDDESETDAPRKPETPSAEPSPMPNGDEDDGGDSEPVPGEDEKPSKADEAFYAQPVKMSDGETLTIGELKDHYQQRAARELEFQQQQSEVAQKRVEMESVLRFFEAAPYGAKYRAAVEMDQQVQREAAAVIDMFPEWRDQNVRAADYQDIMQLAKEYGREAEIGYMLQYPHDRMYVKFLHDFAALRRQVSSARERLRPVEAEKAKPTKTAPSQVSKVQQLADRARATGRHEDETRAVEAILSRSRK